MTNTKRTNKILSWLLCLAMVFTILPMSVYATETSETYTVSLNTSGGNGTLSGDGSYVAGTTVTITATPTDGSCFYMWGGGDGATLADYTEETTTFTMPANDVTITANFRTHSESWGYTEDEHYKTCLFCGEVAGTRATHSYSDDTECECGWTREVSTSTIYTVTFNSNGGSGTMEPQVFTEGVEQALTANTFTREGYVFVHWNTAENGGGQGYTDGQSITVSENITLYALWHQHTYGEYIYIDGSGHYKECTDSGCPDENKGRTATETHNGDINSPMGCTDCHYSTIPLTVSFSPTYLIGGGTISITTSKYADQVTAGSDSIEITTNDHISWTATIQNGQYAHSKFNATAGKESADSEWFDVAATFSLNPTAETLTGGGTVTLITSVPASSVVCDVDGISVQGSGDEWTATLPNSTATYTFTATLDNYTDTCTVSVTAHAHKYTIATCTSAGVCSCGATSGVNPNNHTGGTEIRNAAEATNVAEGYTGDTFCLGCGAKLSSGEVIPKETQISERTDTGIVTFTPGEGLVLPEDAVLVVDPHTPSGDELDFVLGIDADTEYLDLVDERISMYDIGVFSITYEGVTYKMGEYIIIDGLVYFIRSVDSSGYSLHLIRTDNKSDYILHLRSNNLINDRDDRQFDVPTNKKVSINGITYDVKCIFNTSGVNDEERVQWMLYYGGEPVGTYFPGQSRAVFHEGYDPATLNAQKNASNLGTITPGESPVNGLVSGKTYNASVIGSNDISVPGYDEALLNSIKTETEAEKAAKAEVERLKADMEVKKAAVDQLDANDPDHMAAWAAWDEAEIAYEEALAELAALTNLQSATVTQKFQIPDALVGRNDVKFVAVHVTNPHATALAAAKFKMEETMIDYWEYHGDSDEERQRLYEAANRAAMELAIVQEHYNAWEKEHAADAETGNELGTVTIAEDGKTLTATYTVDSFSPFIVYAFVEADEPEYKEITTQTSKPSSSGGGVSRYTVKFDTDGGTTIANKSVIRNSKLAEPDAPTKDGYTFNGWYTDEELTTAYDFDKAVTKGFTLYAKWDKHDDEQTSAFENPFTDVDTSDWFYEDVKYAVENGLFNGTTDTTFAPDGIITRAMMVTVLYRAEGEPATNRSIPFADVDMGAYYANAVIWAKQNDIVKGVSDTEFAPDQNITREQIAAIMHRYAQYKGYDVSVGENTNILSYDDFDSISEYAIAAMQYACGSGLMKGKTTSTLNPLDNATRAEIAAILHRFIEANK